MNKLFVRIASAVIITATICLNLASCGEKPPKTEDVYGRIVELIEKSNDVNMFLFGEGLPVYEYGSDYAEVLGTYNSIYNPEVYDEYISLHSMFASLEHMKNAAKEVYSEKYLESVFESVFTGIKSGDDYLYARYTEDSNWFYQSMLTDPLPISRRVYDYSSMEIVNPSTSDRIKVRIKSYTPDNPENITTFTLTFVYENQNWFLDSPTY